VRAGRRAGPQPPTVVFIHGLGTDSLASFYLTLMVPMAASGVDVLAYDLRGHGRSDRPLTGYAISDFVDDLAALVERLEIAGSVHLIGNSFGGTLTYSYALAHPDQVVSIVAIEAEPATLEWADKMERALANITEDLSRDDTFAWIASTFGAHHARLARHAGERLRETSMVDEVPKGPLVALEQLGDLRCPTLLILGGEGFHAEEPYLLESLLPNCRTVIIQDQDHSVLVESHQAIRGVLVDWVAEHHLPGLVPGRRR
jgi:pimeloyl-ACP methyl ester carboxylesterase